MPDDNQIEIPQSFIALFVRPGHQKPDAPRTVVADRYALCEDMASLLTEHAEALLDGGGGNEAGVLARCRLGLLADPAVFSEREADWIILRLAELLGWTPA